MRDEITLRLVTDTSFETNDSKKSSKSNVNDLEEEKTSLIDKSIIEIKFEELCDFEEIGSGTFAIVLLAKWNGMDVAVKLFRRNVFNNEDSISSFQNEARLMCSLRHKNIVNTFGVCLQKPRLGIVMEYCKQGSLATYISKHLFTCIKDKIAILLDISKGMQFLHLKNIIHRDLKSDNVLVCFFLFPYSK